MSASAAAAPVRLVVADLDGTLLDPGKQVTERSRDAVRKLRAAGIRFTLISARPPRGMKRSADALAVRGVGGSGWHLRRVLGRGARARRPPRSPKCRLGPSLRPPGDVRGGGQGGREGDRVPRPRPARHVRRVGREAGDHARHLPPVQRARPGSLDPPDDPRPAWQRPTLQ